MFAQYMLPNVSYLAQHVTITCILLEPRSQVTTVCITWKLLEIVSYDMITRTRYKLLLCHLQRVWTRQMKLKEPGRLWSVQNKEKWSKYRTLVKIGRKLSTFSTGSFFFRWSGMTTETLKRSVNVLVLKLVNIWARRSAMKGAILFIIDMRIESALRWMIYSCSWRSYWLLEWRTWITWKKLKRELRWRQRTFA